MQTFKNQFMIIVTQDSKAFTQTPVERDLNRGKEREAF